MIPEMKKLVTPVVLLAIGIAVAMLPLIHSETDMVSDVKPYVPQSNYKQSVRCTKDKGYKYREGGQVIRESQLAHELLGNYCGIEIGPGACNPFGLFTVSVGLTQDMDPVDYEYYKNGQIKYCGDYARIDVPGDALNLSAFPTSSVPYVLNSHVWEHVPNPLKALEEWVRVVTHTGVIFVMVPDRCALPEDCARPVTTMADLIHYYETNATLDNFVDELKKIQNENNSDDNYHRGHFIVFTPDLLLQIMLWFNEKYYEQHISLRLVSFLYIDDKLGNGHQIAWQVLKDEQRPKEQIAMATFPK